MSIAAAAGAALIYAISPDRQATTRNRGAIDGARQDGADKRLAVSKHFSI
jgi:hypothetical protein